MEILNYQKKNLKLFSVIIPTYNRANLLRRCLQSLVDQSFKDFEVVVCDDGSTDDTINVVNEYAKMLDIRYFYESNWGGPARPRNKGLLEATGEWVAFLDSDDYWSQAKLAEVFKVIDKGDVIYHRLLIVNEAGEKSGKKLSAKINSPVFENLLIGGNRIPLSSTVCRRKILVDAGGFVEDRNFIAVEDFDLWLRLSKVGVKFYFLPKYLGYYHLGGGNISEVSFSQLKRTRAVYLKYLPDISERCYKRLILGSYFYQEFRMLSLLKEKRGSREALRRVFKYATFFQRAKALLIISFRFNMR